LHGQRSQPQADSKDLAKKKSGSQVDRHYSNQTMTDDVSKLVNLRTLTLSHNSLKILPAALGSLTSLTELWIQSNPLSCIPESLSNLINLSVFTVDSGVPGLASLRQLVIFEEPGQSSRLMSSRSISSPESKLFLQVDAAL
jgi:hypothetical protein